MSLGARRGVSLKIQRHELFPVHSFYSLFVVPDVSLQLPAPSALPSFWNLPSIIMDSNSLEPSRCHDGLLEVRTSCIKALSKDVH